MSASTGTRGPRESTVHAHLAAIGQVNAARDAARPAQELALWAADAANQESAMRLWSMVTNGQVA
eukprot:1107322-Lingulodinium_polyedra.AAC.1